MSFKRDVTEYSEASQMSTTLQMMCWMREKLKFLMTKASSTDKTSRTDSIPFNCDMFVFKSKNLKFFSGNLTSEGHKFDAKKVQAITEMKPPWNFQDLQS